MFSKTCEYAIRAILFVAHRSQGDEKVSIREIAKGIDSPEHFIAKILQNLTRKKLLLSLKGPHGGFYLDAKGRKTSLADIIKAVDGERLFSDCGMGLKQCSETRPCPIHDDYKQIRKQLLQMLENAKVGTFSEELGRNLVFLKRK